MNEAYAITAENLLSVLPDALRNDGDMYALAVGIAELLAARPAEIEKTRIYTRIDELPEDLLDILAYDFKVDWWDPNYTVEQKRSIFKQNWAVHKKLGTRYAVETALNAIYPGTTIEEWFEYDGEPYHFRVLLDIMQSGKLNTEQIQRVIMYYTRLTAVLDEVIYQMFATAENRNTLYFDTVDACFRIENPTVYDGGDESGGRLDFRTFSAVGMRIRNVMTLTFAETGFITEAYTGETMSFVKADFMAAVMETTEHDYILREFSVIGTTARNNENITGSLSADNTWILNGEVPLDGSRKLSYLIEEEI